MSARVKIAVLALGIVAAMAFVAWSDGEHSNAGRVFLRGLLRQLF